MAMGNYWHVEYASVVNLKISKNKGSRPKKVDFVATLRSSLIFQTIFTCNMAMKNF